MKKLTKLFVLLLTFALSFCVLAGCIPDDSPIKPTDPGDIIGNLMKYKVSYIVSGDTDKEIYSESVTQGMYATRPSDSVLSSKLAEGYLFVNWYADKEYSEVFNFSRTQITANTSVYAKLESKDVCAFTDDKLTKVSTGTFDAYELTDAVASNTSEYNIDGLAKSAGTTIEVYNDSSFSNKLANPASVTIAYGQNTFYVKLINNGKNVSNKVSITLTRTPKFAVRFMNGITQVGETEYLSEGSTVTERVLTRVGYDLENWYTISGQSKQVWDFDNDKVDRNLTLYAEWKVQTYTVTLSVPDDDSVSYEGIKSFSVRYGTTRAGLDNYLLVNDKQVFPTHEYGKFAGWKYNDTLIYDANGKGLVDWTYTTDATLVPVWNYSTFDITATAGAGGNVAVDSDTVAYLGSTTLRATPDAGYRFVGWRDAATNTIVSTNEVYAVTLSSPNDIAFVASFEVISTTVTLNLNYDGAAAPSTVTATYGEAVSLGRPAARADARFVGWAYVTGVDEVTNENVYSVITNNQGVPNGNIEGVWEDGFWALDKAITPFTLYAVWEANVYNVKILYGEEGAGTITFPATTATATTYKYEGVTLNGFGATGLAYNTNVAITAPTSEAGRVFLKWVDVYGAVGALADLPAVDVTNGITLNDEDVYLVAVWDYVDVTITKVAQPGEAESPTQVVKYGQDFNLGTLTPTDPHHTFGGWVFDLTATPLAFAADKNGESVAAVTTDVSVYAYWAPVQYEIKATNRTLDEHDAAITAEGVIAVNFGGTVNLAASQKFDYGYTITARANAKNGYYFIGWYTVDAQGALSATPVSSDANYTFNVAGVRSLCALFKVNQYTISFDAADYVDVNPTSVQVYYGKDYTLTQLSTLNHPARDGQYEFLGWYVTYGGNDINITDNAGEGLSQWTIASDIVAHPKWQSIFHISNGVVTGLSEYGRTLDSITIPATCDGIAITGIGAAAFAYNTGLTSITIGSNVTSIGTMAFAGCTNLTTVTIQPNSKLNSVGTGAFLNCKALTSLAFQRSLVAVKNNSTTGIQPEALSGCSGLTSLTIDGSVVLGTLFGSTNYDAKMKLVEQNTYYYIPTGLTTVTIGSGSEIADFAYMNCDMLTTVNVASTVTRVGDRAFMGCTSISAFDFANVMYIGNGSFAESGIVDTGSLAIVRLGTGAFAGCADLTTVNLTNSTMNTIPDDAFKNCTALNSISFTTVANNKITAIGENAFYNCTTLGTIAAAGISAVETVGRNAFRDSAINAATVNGFSAIRRVGFNAFHGTTWFNEVSATVLYVGGGRVAYYLGDGYNIATVGLDAGIISIADGAFAARTTYAMDGAINLAAFTNLEYIGTEAFLNSRITSLTLPNTVETIASSAFKGCASLTTVSMDRTNSALKTVSYEAFKDCTALNALTLANGITKIGTNAFENDRALVTVALPDYLREMGEAAFKNCVNLTTVTFANVNNFEYTVNGSGDEVPPLYNEAASIGVLATEVFMNTAITTITLPHTISTISTSAFEGCDNLAVINYIGTLLAPTHNNAPKVRLTTIGARAFKDCTILNNALPGSVTTITSIGSQAFENCRSLTSITLNKLTDIANYAFNNCVMLATISISSDTKPASIGEGAFNNCRKLTSMTIPSSVTKIGDYAFTDCVELSSVSMLSTGLTYIGREAFKNTLIQSFTLPASVIEIAESAFIGCLRLTSFGINADSSKLEVIGLSAFKGCTGIKSITLPKSLVAIRGEAFENCTGLETVTVYEKVTSIGSRAFAGCTSLDAVIFTGTVPPTLGGNVFAGSAATYKVVVSKEYVDTFSSALGWDTVNVVSDEEYNA